MKSGYVEQRRKFISDAFHTLNQPLTGLHCGLEITLQRPRTEGEYRQRIGECVQYATATLAVVRAIRQLVDAADAGERFGTVDLGLLLAQARSDLEVVSETTGITVEVTCETDVAVAADPAKLLSVLEGLLAAEMESYQPGAIVKVVASATKKAVAVVSRAEGTRKPTTGEETQSAAEKLAEIRKNAAVSYLWTLRGDFESQTNGFKIKLPIAR